jgi:hypothetical protein
VRPSSEAVLLRRMEKHGEEWRQETAAPFPNAGLGPQPNSGRVVYGLQRSFALGFFKHYWIRAIFPARNPLAATTYH